MDIIAHTLWAGAAAALAPRRLQIEPRTIVATMTLAALPDLPQFVPILGWALFGEGSWAALAAHAVALPGHEPPMPPFVAYASHHLHCIAHSAVVAAAVGAAMWIATRSLWIPLLGWWSHIVIDVFTHSAEYYPTPVLYPITYRGFDGVAWHEPWFMALNYAALAVLGAWALYRGLKPGRVEPPTPATHQPSRDRSAP